MEGSCSEPRTAFSAAWLVLGRSHGFIVVVCVPVLWLGSYNRDFGQPKRGTTMETLGRSLCVGRQELAGFRLWGRRGFSGSFGGAGV